MPNLACRCTCFQSISPFLPMVEVPTFLPLADFWLWPVLNAWTRRSLATDKLRLQERTFLRFGEMNADEDDTYATSAALHHFARGYSLRVITIAYVCALYRVCEACLATCPVPGLCAPPVLCSFVSITKSSLKVLGS